MKKQKKIPTKNKKSRRSNAKKGKAKNLLMKTDNPQQSIVNNKEQIEPSLPPLNLATIIQEQKPSNIQNSSTIPKTPSNDNNENSSAFRSRKNKKKKPIATTTVIEKSSSPNRNLFLVIKERIRNRKITAFKCVFILICLCLSIIILVLSHK